jgi:hypothetical protein
MSYRMSSFAPSERALTFGKQYAEVLDRWSELFGSAAGLVRANVELGELAQDAAKEFEDWIQGTAAGPLSWFNPEMIRTFMQRMAGEPPAP